MRRRALLAVMLLLTPLAAWAPAPSAAASTDTEPPSFGAPLPEEDVWIASSPAFLAVQVSDNGSGVDPARVEFSWEWDGAPFVHWYPADVSAGAAPGQWEASISMSLPEGNLSNVVWRAWDRAGNGPGESRIFHVQVDTQNVTFHDPRPAVGEWVSEPYVTPEVWITAATGPVPASNVSYRISYAGLGAFGAWVPDCEGVQYALPPRGFWEGCMVIYKMDFANNTIEYQWGLGYSAQNYSPVEGNSNWLQWLASPNGSDRTYISPPYQILYDSRPPVVVSAMSNGLLPLAPVDLLVTAHDGSPVSVLQRGLNTSLGSATYRVRLPSAPNFGEPLPLAATNISVDNWSADFSATLNLPRGTSTVEVSVSDQGGLATTVSIPVHVNEDPTVSLLLPNPVDVTTAFHDEGSGTWSLLAGANHTLRAVAQDDGPGPLTFSWTDCSDGAPPLAAGPDLLLSPDAPAPLSDSHVGNLTLCVRVTDGLDGATVLRVEIYLEPLLGGPPTAPAPPPAPTVLPTGSPALWFLVLLAAAACALVLLPRLRRRQPPDAADSPSDPPRTESQP